ncbi:hypothetical protein ABID21_003147 [Pseudorhizobium tarimense]|uniref:Uncharacterized protein n=1 Tax=Pseudorhizobium tarimense TaxID=1079109 RepID=A0ABV2H8Z5_9HYPH|nr:hypothetical protein [Pseudorhizobium tarimense]MCJ8520147.1 hypothetical protein [Pseudorhizobium tarimense]
MLVSIRPTENGLEEPKFHPQENNDDIFDDGQEPSAVRDVRAVQKEGPPK